MKTLLLAIVTLTSTTAFADGFKCDANRESLAVKVFNHTDPSEGTRNASVMVLSDTGVNYGNKTIARFTDLNSTLTNKAALYIAKVDLRYSDSERKGELIGGTKLGYLAKVILNVDFTYSNPAHSGAILPATLSLVKRNGDVIDIDMSCKRYLKN